MTPKIKFNRSTDEDLIDFPAVYESLRSDLLVLFFTKTVGAQLFKGFEGSVTMGIPCDSWMPCSDATIWKRAHGTITIEQ